MRQNKEIKKQKAWILVPILLILAGVGYIVYNPDFLPPKISEYIHAAKQVVGLEQKYGGKEYFAVEGGGDSVRISDKELRYVIPDEDFKPMFDDDNEAKYVDNLLRIITHEILSPEEVDEIVKPYGGKVVGYNLNNNRSYYAKLDKRYSPTDLSSMQKKIEENPAVFVTNQATRGGIKAGSYTPNDAMWNYGINFEKIANNNLKEDFAYAEK